MKKDIIFSDWASTCEGISPLHQQDKWWEVPFTTAEYEGTLISAFYESCPEDLVIRPKLTGWHRIYVCMMLYDQSGVEIKLSSDSCFDRLTPIRGNGWDEYTLEESLWRCAELTGEEIRITRKRYSTPFNTVLAWLRFEPMDEEAVKAWKAEFSDPDTKRLYATNDMCTATVGSYHMTSHADWHQVLTPYRDSDVEWVGLENTRVCIGGSGVHGNSEQMAHLAPYNRSILRQQHQAFTAEMLQDLVRAGHDMGLKLCGTARVNCMCMGFPILHNHHDIPFYLEHPEYRCVDRDGTVIERLSYAYPEVRQYLISELLFMAEQGFDAVGPLFNRGQPNVLFEKPVADAFFEAYGEYPYELPLADPRLNKIHCRFLTQFMRELRAALDARFGERHIEIHAKVMLTMQDCLLVGLDLEEWAKQGLVDILTSYPRVMYEKLEGDIWKNTEKTRIDPEKYRDYANRSSKSIILDPYDYDYCPPDAEEDYVNLSKTCQFSKARVADFMELEKRYGVKVYFDIMPRALSQQEYRDFAQQLYDMGAERLTLWDTYSRVSKPAMWSMVRRLGHKGRLPEVAELENREYRYIRMLSVAGRDESRYKSHWGG